MTEGNRRAILTEAMEIGEPRRVIVVEPLEDPVPREAPEPPPEPELEPPAEAPAEPEKVRG